METDVDTFFVKDREKKPIFVRVWKPVKDKPKAILQIIHGMSEHSGRYSHVGRYFSEKGFIVFAHDHRGHGQTDPDQLGHIAHERGLDALAENIGDIKKQITSEHPDLPVIMLGHSMGSFCLQRYFQLTNDRADAIIYSGSNGRPSRLLPVGIWTTSALMKIWGGEKRSPFLDNLLSKSFIAIIHLQIMMKRSRYCFSQGSGIRSQIWERACTTWQKFSPNRGLRKWIKNCIKVAATKC
jgi:alpha-beta hydrolase superfamily lysophospholipase